MNNVIGYLALYLVIVVPLCLVYGLCTFFKKFDAKLKNVDYILDTKIPVQSSLIRLNSYILGIVAGNLLYKTKNPFRDAYHNFNFRAHASLLDKVVCYLYWYSCLFVLSIGLIYYLTSFIYSLIK